jgi:hypothetical protein
VRGAEPQHAFVDEVARKVGEFLHRRSLKWSG